MPNIVDMLNVVRGLLTLYPKYPKSNKIRIKQMSLVVTQPLLFSSAGDRVINGHMSSVFSSPVWMNPTGSWA